MLKGETLIIVEGPDGAGKTTMVRMLMEELDWPVAPRVVSHEAQAMVDLVEWTEENVRKPLEPMLYDRHRLISEPIYGPILRNKMEPGFDDVRWLGRMHYLFRDKDPLVIFCLPPLQTVLNNIEGDPNNLAVVNTIRVIYYLYLNAAASWPTDELLVWDYTKPEKLSTLMATVKGWARYKELWP